MSEIDLRVEIDGDIIVVMDPVTRYYALYTKPSDCVEAHCSPLTLLRRRPTKDQSIVALAAQAASAKARELGWIV
jgi:hypothetical protein